MSSCFRCRSVSFVFEVPAIFVETAKRAVACPMPRHYWNSHVSTISIQRGHVTCSSEVPFWNVIEANSSSICWESLERRYWSQMKVWPFKFLQLVWDEATFGDTFFFSHRSVNRFDSYQQKKIFGQMKSFRTGYLKTNVEVAFNGFVGIWQFRLFYCFFGNCYHEAAWYIAVNASKSREQFGLLCPFWNTLVGNRRQVVLFTWEIILSVLRWRFILLIFFVSCNSFLFQFSSTSFHSSFFMEWNILSEEMGFEKKSWWLELF